MPTLGLTGSVLQGETKDGIALLDGVLLVRLAGESLSDSVESGGRRELVCNATPSATWHSRGGGGGWRSRVCLPFFRDIVAV
jgi:hypothetical protein